MKFSKIGMSKDLKVTLKRKDEHTHSKDDIVTTGVNPLPEFRDAVQAFMPHFLSLVPSMKNDTDKLRVTTISLGEKDGKRALQVSVSYAVEACNGAAISMTTPRIGEAAALEGEDDEEETAVATLSPTVLKLIENVEFEATRYANGETAQLDAFKSSENTKNVNEAMGAASVASTRKPRATKPAATTTPLTLQ